MTADSVQNSVAMKREERPTGENLVVRMGRFYFIRCAVTT
jgi:hypothetical protein